MDSKQTVMQLANDVIRYLNACADEDFVEGVLERINDGVEFGEDEIGEEECRAARPLIKKRVEQIIDEYNFPQLERDEIMYTIADVLTDRLLPEKRRRSK